VSPIEHRWLDHRSAGHRSASIGSADDRRFPFHGRVRIGRK
jgi:hypothetical protein